MARLTRPRNAARAAVPRRRVRLVSEERRRALLALGLRAFSTHPYDEVAIEDLAREAGISKGLLYHYFPTKRDFYVATLREAASELQARTLTPPAGATPLDRLRHGVMAYLEYVRRHARSYAAVLRGGIGSDPEVVALLEQMRTAYLERLLEGAAEAGLPVAELRRPLVHVALRGWMGFVETASLAWVTGPRRRGAPGAAELAALLVDVLLATLERAVRRPAGG